MELMLETNSAELEAAQDRFLKLQDRAANNFGYGATVEGLHIAQGCFERLAEALEAKLDEPVTLTRGPTSRAKRDPATVAWDEKVHRMLKTVSPHVVALATINNALRGAMDQLPYNSVLVSTGRAINHEVFAHELRQHDEKLTEKIEKWVTEKHGNLKYRLQSARLVARKMGFSFVNQWTPAQLVTVGNFVMDVLLETLSDLFVRVPDGDSYRIEITEGAAKLAQSAMQQFIRLNPIFLPSVVPPVPWTGWNTGGPVDPVAQKLGSVVRTRHRETIAAVKGAIKSGQMQPALDALNAVQSTPWCINAYVAHVMKECVKRGVNVEGLPQREDFPLPTLEDGAWEAMSDEQKKAWRSEKESIKRANLSLASDRLRYDEDMETVEVLAEHERFYIPHNLDWRGREYPMTNFNFQREDRVRSLFLFGDGEPIGEEGIQWLKVHVANCGDFGKVSKKSYDERIKWVDDNFHLIKDCAMQDWEHGGPLTNEALSFWTKADKPFLFLAACVELTKALQHGPEYVCALPVSWDGSCSGLQHLCCATRSEDGWKVNLTDREAPEDIYQIVADAATKAMEQSPDPIAKVVLAYDGNRRKVYKRNVMTTFYGSKKFGMAQQHMDDLMEPLRLEVMKKKRKVHPFGKTWAEHQAASRFIANHAAAAIAQEAPLAIKAMEFLQTLAGAMAHEGKPLEWTSPIGLPWSNRYHESKVEMVSLWMHDAGVKIRYRAVVADGHKKDIDRKRAVNGSAPNFVHALDASHLLLTVLAALREGISQFALVHDSFGCLPSVAARFQGIIRETLVEMYETHDVLTEVLERAKCDLSEHNTRLSEIEDMRSELTGTLNIKEVLHAQYAFA